MSDSVDMAAAAWEQFNRTAVSEDAKPYQVFAWAYLAGWAHDRWPTIRDIVPPPDIRTTANCEDRLS